MLSTNGRGCKAGARSLCGWSKSLPVPLLNSSFLSCRGSCGRGAIQFQGACLELLQPRAAGMQQLTSRFLDVSSFHEFATATCVRLGCCSSCIAANAQAHLPHLCVLRRCAGCKKPLHGVGSLSFLRLAHSRHSHTSCPPVLPQRRTASGGTFPAVKLAPQLRTVVGL